MRELPQQLTGLYFFIASLAPLSLFSQSVVVNNPSSCSIGLNLMDGACDPNINVVPDPERVVVNVNNAPGSILGTDVYLREVQLIIRHTWANDLDIRLRSPGGIEIPLSLDNGGGDDNYGDPNVPDCAAPVRFSMESCVSITEGEPPFTDIPYRPEGSFFRFNDGQTDPNGLWTLSICDDAAGDLGRLEYVNLIFAPIVCLPVESVELLNQDTTAVTVNWSPFTSCGNSIIEYGPAGFTPGTDGNAGQGTLAVVNGCPPFTLTGLQEQLTYDLYVRKVCGNGQFSLNSCPITFEAGCQPPPPSLHTDFDGLTDCAPFCDTECEFEGVWFNSRQDGFDWLVRQGSTPTFGTGPASDVSGDGKYAYLETSGETCELNKTAYLLSNCIQLNKMGSDTCHLSFYYHMSGAGIGTLALQASTDGGFSWATLWEKAGNQGSSWKKAFIGLDAYPDGESLQLRFAGTEIGSSRGDIALDEITFYGSQDLGKPGFTYFADQDNDGFGNDSQPLLSCAGTPPQGYAAMGGDCNDNNPSINPAAPEVPCNSIDENCNGNADDPVLPPPAVTFDTICSGEPATVCASPAFDNTFIFWYAAPEGDDLIGFGECYSPGTTLINNGPAPITLRIYAEESDLVCISGQRAEAVIVVNPLPNVSTAAVPEICAGETFDLASVNIEDANFTGGEITYHSALPATDANELPATLVSPLEPTTYFYQLTSPAGCSDAGSINLEATPGPALSFSPANSFSLCRENSTALSVQAGGGEAPYSFQWSTGATSSEITISAAPAAGQANFYAVTVTDSEGCISVDSAQVNTTASIDSLRRSVTEVSSCGGNDGSIRLIPLAGMPPFSYQWQGTNGVSGDTSGIADTLLISGLPQGSYRITVSDNSEEACSLVLRSVIINGPGAVVQGVDVQPVQCTGATDGEICLDVFGGSPQYLWSTGATTSCISGLAGGQYAVTVTDGECESIIEDISVPEPDSLKLITTTQAPSCFNAGDGAIRTSVFGGTPPYSYRWSNSRTSKDISSLAAGNYTLTLTDANNCSLVRNITLDAPAAVSIELDSLRDMSCTGRADGFIRVGPQGGTPPFDYQWSNGSNAPIIVGLGKGSYQVTATDFNGCQASRSFTIEEPEPVSLSLVSIAEPECVGDKNGRIEVAASGGTPAYQYSWNIPGTDSVLNNLPVGTYIAVASDANNCPADSLEIELDAFSQLELGLVVDAPDCIGQGGGSISLQPEGTAPFSYQWARGDTTATISGVAVGQYPVRIEDGEGCLFDTLISVEAPQVFDVNVSVIQPSCFRSGDGLIDIALTQSGTPPLQYDWSDGGSGALRAGLEEGQYVSTITDALGCALVTDPITIASPPRLELGIEGVGDIRCFGDSTGFIEVSMRGGTPPYSYNWVGQEATTEDLYNIPAGSYRLLVQDINSCPLDTTFLLTQPQQLNAAIEVSADGLCEGGAVEELLPNVRGGAKPYSFLWSNGSRDSVLQEPEPADYILIVTDHNGCMDTSESVKVKEFIQPFRLDTFYLNAPSCSGETDGCMTAAVSGGSFNYRYHFSNGYIINTSQGNVSRCGLATGNYRVTVTDLSSGCSAVSPNLSISEPPPLFFRRDSISSVDCAGGNDGGIFTTASGGTPPYIYSWFDDEEVLLSNAADLTGVPAGRYTGYLTDQNGCTASVSGTVLSLTSTIRDTLVRIEHVACKGGTTGSVQPQILGGTPPLSYEWNTGATSPQLTGIPAGTYSLTVTDAQGCQAAFTGYTVNEPESALQAQLLSNSISCHGDEDGRIEAAVSGGAPPYEYEWRRNAEPILTADTNLLTGLGPGVYTLELRDANNCIRSYQVELTEPEELAVSISLSPPLPPEPGLAVAAPSGGSPPYDYLWSTGERDDTVAVQQGQYSLTVTDDNGCTANANINVVSTYETDLVESVRLFPNPTAGQARLEIKLRQPAALQMELLGLLGQPILTQKMGRIREETLVLDVEGLPAGPYWLILKEGGKLVYGAQLIKQ